MLYINQNPGVNANNVNIFINKNIITTDNSLLPLKDVSVEIYPQVDNTNSNI